MDQISSFFIGNTTMHYVEGGFSDREASAMAWIADQKPLGKYVGTVTGSFVALTWGHFHQRVMSHFSIRCSKLYSQLFILGVCLLIFRVSSRLEITWLALKDLEPTSISPTDCILTTTFLWGTSDPLSIFGSN